MAAEPGNAECTLIAAEIRKLRDADDAALDALCEDSIDRRLRWFLENKARFVTTDDLLHTAYELLLERLRITEQEAPVVKRTDREIVFHSMNFCPTLEACKRLGLDTRHVCKRINERSTDLLLKQIDPRLKFSRNYDRLRPHAEYCEEMISLSENTVKFDASAL